MNSLIIFSAKYLIVLPVILIGLYWLRLDNAAKKRFVLAIVPSGILAYMVSKLAGALYYNPRPFVSEHITPLIAHTNNNGFPSDHTLLASLLGFVVLLWSRRLGACLLVIALIIGSSRVLARVHHPIDIIGSFVISALSTIIVFYLSRYLNRSKNVK